MGNAGAWGVDEGFTMATGEWRQAPPATVEAVLAAMGAGGDGGPPEGGAPLFVRGGPGGAPRPGPGVLVTEDGSEVPVEEGLPEGLPLGYHRFCPRGGGERLVVVSPGRCRLPGRRTWGWAVQLYAARSGASWGIGDLADLRRLARWSAAELGAGLLMVNPLHAALPARPQTASPYFPSSRRFRNPLYLRVEDVPGAADLGDELAGLAQAGRRLNGDRRVDRDEVHRLKITALERLFARSGADPGFDDYRRSGGDALDSYATFCVLDECLGRPWHAWPEAYRHPAAAGVASFRAEQGERVRFHQWLQWQLSLQLDGAAGEISLIHDLAVGVDPAGADAWLWQDSMALGMSVGAPPDEFNTRGQDWGLPPFDPWKLRAAGYEPFIQTVRSALAPGGGMRLDHVMGLFRLYWIPRGADATEGTYVHYPAGDLLDIVALESHRAGSYVVGEDLGTVEDRVRAELSRRDILSYRLLWFEPEPPERWPEKALAAVTTHDLPTVAGLWSGADIEAQRAIDLQPNEQATEATRARLGGAAGTDRGAPVDEVVTGAYGRLAGAPCLLLAATLDDVLGVEERPNMPGTTDEWPNWSIALPVTLDELETDPRARRLAGLLSRPG